MSQTEIVKQLQEMRKQAKQADLLELASYIVSLASAEDVKAAQTFLKIQKQNRK